MTKQKHLKERVRARMSKTGESYSSARRHIVVAEVEPSEGLGYQLRRGIHPDTAALANALANHGVIASHSQRPLSEAMILGIGGGLGAGYILWQFKGQDPKVVLGFRNQWQYPDKWLTKTCDRLGVRVELRHTSGPTKASAFLDEALDSDGPRPLVWIDAQEVGYWQLPEHLSGHGGYPIVVYGREGDSYLIDDRNSERLTVDHTTLRAARDRVSSYQNRLARLETPVEVSSGRLAAALGAGLGDQIEHLSASSDSFSLPAWRKWSRMMTDDRNPKGWRRAFRDQAGLFGVLLTLYESVESSGYDGGTLRDVYAQFLDEAAGLLSKPELSSVAASYREIDSMWARVADMAAPSLREPFATARKLIDTLHECVLEEGDFGHGRAADTGRALWALRARFQEEAVYEAAEFDELLSGMAESLDAIYEKESKALSQLAAAIRDKRPGNRREDIT